MYLVFHHLIEIIRNSETLNRFCSVCVCSLAHVRFSSISFFYYLYLACVLYRLIYQKMAAIMVIRDNGVLRDLTWRENRKHEVLTKCRENCFRSPFCFSTWFTGSRTQRHLKSYQNNYCSVRYRLNLCSVHHSQDAKRNQNKHVPHATHNLIYETKFSVQYTEKQLEITMQRALKGSNGI